jgi:putative OmpL-like beta-barrel porin-2
MRHMVPGIVQPGAYFGNERQSLRRFGLAAALLAASGLTAAGARAQVVTTPGAATAPPAAVQGGSPNAIVPSPTPVPPANPTQAAQSWSSSIALTAQIEGGVLFNPDRPADGQNFGHLYTDHANQAQLNQVLLTATRPTDPNAKGYDFGFDFQLMYGSDVRYNHYLEQFQNLITQRYQLGIVQADILAHLPWLTSGGIDAKIGEFPSIMGMETLDPSTNPFYSHSYIYNYGVTFFHTGIITTTHVSPMLDLWLGVDTGNTTTFGAGDNNSEPAGYVGVGLNNLFNGKVTVLATSHLGPENALRVDPDANSQMRYFNDILVTYKATKTLTSSTEFNYIKDDGYHAEGYGVSQYLSYVLTPTITLNGRGEIFRDDSGFFVANFPDNLGIVKASLGYPTTVIAAPPTTYSELTLGITYKPTMPKPISLLMIRPEIRYDRSLNGTHPYNAGRSLDQFTFGGDFLLAF